MSRKKTFCTSRIIKCLFWLKKWMIFKHKGGDKHKPKKSNAELIYLVRWTKLSQAMFASLIVVDILVFRLEWLIRVWESYSSDTVITDYTFTVQCFDRITLIPRQVLCRRCIWIDQVYHRNRKQWHSSLSGCSLSAAAVGLATFSRFQILIYFHLFIYLFFEPVNN